jgi:hypothetical protein
MNRAELVDKICISAGAPWQCIRKATPIDQIIFDTVALLDNKQKVKTLLDENRQKAVFTQMVLAAPEYGFPAVYAFGAAQQEKLAQDMVAYLLKLYLESALTKAKLPEVKWFDLGFMDWNYFSSHNRPDVTVLTGINDQSEIKRIELAKDLIRKYERSTCFVVVGTGNILEFISNRLRMSTNACWQVKKEIQKKVFV